jgi:beta-glucosidase/6-phospho-beta-glucosidase/beta-galactosidase
VPDWIGNFQNPELPMYFMDYADAVSRRYPWVRYYTPVNEIFVTARLSAKDGLWNEQLRTDQGFVTALKHLTAANILSSHSIVRNRPDAVFVHSESAELIHRLGAMPCRVTALANKQRFVALDLLYARAPDAEICTWLLDNGMRRAEYDWFMAGEPPGHQVLGLDYYGRNEHIVTPTGRRIPAEDVLGWYLMAREYFERYRKPLMHTETNVFDAGAAPAWLWKQWINTLRLRADGIPVLGFTWYSLIDQIDWDIALSEMRGTVNGCGLYDLQRRPNPVAAEFRAMVQEFGDMSLTPNGELVRSLVLS